MTRKVICMIQRRFDYGRSRAFSDSIIGTGIKRRRRLTDSFDAVPKTSSM